MARSYLQESYDHLGAARDYGDHLSQPLNFQGEGNRPREGKQVSQGCIWQCQETERLVNFSLRLHKAWGVPWALYGTYGQGWARQMLSLPTVLITQSSDTKGPPRGHSKPSCWSVESSGECLVGGSRTGGCLRCDMGWEQGRINWHSPS